MKMNSINDAFAVHLDETVHHTERLEQLFEHYEMARVDGEFGEVQRRRRDADCVGVLSRIRHG